MADDIVLYTMALLVGGAATIAAIATVACVIVFRKAPNELAAVLLGLTERASLIQIAAVVGIVVVVFILSLGGKLDSQEAATILSGIAG